MRFTTEEEQMLSGAEGPAVQWAMEVQKQTGEFFGATHFEPITNAHIVVDVEIMGAAGYALVETFARSATTRFRVPTTTNSQFVDPAYRLFFNQDELLTAQQLQVNEYLSQMGAMIVNSCIPYQATYQPHFGEHVAWGDTGTVCYSNSVFGSRSNFEAGSASLAAALTGRVPYYGFHRPEVRRGTALAEVTATLTDFADWGALGAIIGRLGGNYFEVPIITGLTATPTSDHLKHMAAALASYGSIAMFGIEGLTPEAQTLSQAFGKQSPRQQFTVGDKELQAFYESYKTQNDQADVVVFSGPQQSIYELRLLAEALDGKRIHPNTALVITTNHSYLQIAEKLGYAKTIRDAGGTILEGTCFYLMTLDSVQQKHGWRTIVTNSAKVANIVGAYDVEPVLRRTHACIQSALTGKVAY